jgi:TRAP-type uncharacterized transport system fused permease subunit
MEILKNEWFYVLPLVVITIFMLLGYSPGYAAILGLVTCILVSHKRAETKIDLSMVWIIAFVFVVDWCLAGLSWAQGPEAAAALKRTLAEPVRWLAVPIGAVMGPEAGVAIGKTLRDNALILYGIGLAVAIAYWRQSRGADVKAELGRFVYAARKGAEASLKIGATVGVIGIIIGVLTYSGLVLTFADIVIELADGKLWLTILLIALASLILGMGVPVTAAYLITAVVAVPALTEIGVNPIAAHMIVYWLSQDSNITPPVCIAAFAGATIAKANMWKTAFSAFKFAKFLYLGPFLFGYVPAFSLDGSATDIVVAFVLILVGTWAYSWILSGIWMEWFKKAPAAS